MAIVLTKFFSLCYWKSSMLIPSSIIFQSLKLTNILSKQGDPTFKIVVSAFATKLKIVWPYLADGNPKIWDWIIKYSS